MKKSHLIAFSASFGLLLASIVMTAFFWGDLPARIPIHFGITGAPDAWTEKNLVYLFIPPAIQLLLSLLFILLYRHPQYSSWPTTLILMTVDEPKREKIYSVLKSMLTTTLVIITAIFAYIQFAVLATANGRANGVSTPIMIVFGVALLGLILYFNVRMFTTVHRIVKKSK